MILSLLEILFPHLCLFLIINMCIMFHEGYIMKAICVFVGSLGLFWTWVYVGESWDTFLSHLFLLCIMSFYAN
jgi:hypothetical protein